MPVVEPKVAITVDLTAELSPLIKNVKLDEGSTITAAGRLQTDSSEAAPSISQSASAKSELSYLTAKPKIVLGPIETEPTNSSQAMADPVQQPDVSSAKFFRPAFKEAAEREECSIQ